ncbi:MAG TPA: hypothetical protein VFA11_10030 [Acidimicrobiales bacterium]|nr:hypothetical protein [Acidimicrobiales bacterium]
MTEKGREPEQDEHRGDKPAQVTELRHRVRIRRSVRFSATPAGSGQPLDAA